MVGIDDEFEGRGMYIAATSEIKAKARFYSTQLFQEYVHETDIMPDIEVEFKRGYKQVPFGNFEFKEISDLGLLWFQCIECGCDVEVEDKNDDNYICKNKDCKHIGDIPE